MNTLRLTLFFLWLSFAHATSNDPENILRMSSFGFELKKKNNKQVFLQNEEAKSLHPQAVAAVVIPEQPFYSFLMLDPAFENLSVEEYSKFTIQELPVEEKKLVSFQCKPVQELASCSFQLTGKMEQDKIGYQVSIISSNGIFYHLVSFMLDDEPTKKLLSLAPELKILKGITPLLKSNAQTARGRLYGQDFIVKDNRIVYPGYGFSVPIQIDQWTYLGREEAQNIHPLALNAWNQGEEMLFYIIAEAGANYKQLESTWLETFGDATPPKPLPAPGRYRTYMAGRDLILETRFSSSKHTGLFMVGVSESEHSTQIMRLQSSIQWETEEKIKSALNTLHNGIDKNLILGPEQSFYENIYKNYSVGFTFHFDKNDVIAAYVPFKLGLDETGGMDMENESKSYFAKMRFQEGQFAKPLEYHKIVLDALLTKDTSIIEFNGFYGTPFKSKETSKEYLVISGVHQEQYFNGLFWGKSLNFEQLTKQIQWTDQIDPYSISKEKFIHSKLGFSFKLQPEMKLSVNTPEDLAPLGEVIDMELPDGKATLYVVHAGLMDPELIFDLYSQKHKLHFHMDLSNETTYDFMGHEVLSRTFKSRDHLITQSSFFRGDTIFSLITTSKKKAPWFFHDQNFSLNLRGE